MSRNFAKISIKPRYRTAFALFFCALCAASVLLFPTLAAESLARSCKRFYLRLLPALFPMMILSRRMAAYMPVPHGKAAKLFCRLSGLSENELPLFVIGLLCGYPLPAVLAAKEYENGGCDAEEAARRAALFDNASPGFLIAFAGSGLLGSVKYGIFLYTAQVLSVLCTARLFPAKIRSKKTAARQSANTLAEDIRQSARLLTELFAFTAAFSLLADFIGAVLRFFHAPSCLTGFAAGLLEITDGCVMLAGGTVPKKALCLMLPFLSGMGGASVLLQVRAALPPPLSIRPYLAMRPVTAVLMTACFQIMTAVSP